MVSPIFNATDDGGRRTHRDGLDRWLHDGKHGCGEGLAVHVEVLSVVEWHHAVAVLRHEHRLLSVVAHVVHGGKSLKVRLLRSEAVVLRIALVLAVGIDN